MAHLFLCFSDLNPGGGLFNDKGTMPFPFGQWAVTAQVTVTPQPHPLVIKDVPFRTYVLSRRTAVIRILARLTRMGFRYRKGSGRDITTANSWHMLSSDFFFAELSDDFRDHVGHRSCQPHEDAPPWRFR